MSTRSSITSRISSFVNGLFFLFLYLLMHFPVQKIRHIVLQCLGMKIGKRSVIYAGTEIRSPSRIIVGSGTSIGHNCVLDGRGGLTIGNNVNLSSEVMIWTRQHDPQSSNFEGISRQVIVKDYAWLSCRTVILPGVLVGEGAVVAAGAVVTKTVDPYTIVTGIPAILKGKRNSNLNYTCGDSIWFV